MSEITAPLAQALHAILPGWVVLPNMTFALPHTIYWSGIVFFPLIAAYLVHRAERDRTGSPVSLAVAYMFLVASGFIGLHRFYLRAPKFAVVFLALFFLVLHANGMGAVEREVVSKTQNDFKIAAYEVKYSKKRVQKGVKGANAELAKAQVIYVKAKADLAEATLKRAQWGSLAGFVSYLVFFLLLIDAYLIRRLYRDCLAREPARDESEFKVMERGSKHDPRRDIHIPFTRWVDKINRWVGNYVAYWAVIAVFIYYYEVIARYVFNAPTNWAHEGMFLMFGMQYLLAGGYALLEDSHVRVDVLYENCSFRTKAIIDIVTSVFFFIFAGALLVTGWIFLVDAIDVWEVSFTEWAIQYWPVKATIFIGALLIILQGISKLATDITALKRQGA